MKVSREQATQNRERIVQVAAKLFRERGFDGDRRCRLDEGRGADPWRFLRAFRVKGRSGRGGLQPCDKPAVGNMVGRDREVIYISR